METTKSNKSKQSDIRTLKKKSFFLRSDYVMERKDGLKRTSTMTVIKFKICLHL